LEQEGGQIYVSTVSRAEGAFFLLANGRSFRIKEKPRDLAVPVGIKAYVWRKEGSGVWHSVFFVTGESKPRADLEVEETGMLEGSGYSDHFSTQDSLPVMADT
jgi:hypothetical protein